MIWVSLLVNGAERSGLVEPRLHLADFLRDELLLHGTHLGCEQGVCGACTVLLDGEPVRACLAPAATCKGREVRSIEGLQDDAAMFALRAAFTAAHALQCGYCTPGMLITARDIVLRLPDADDARIRLELAGNLCRCTGYDGIVRAIRSVLDQHLDFPAAVRPPVPASSFARRAETTGTASVAAPAMTVPASRGTNSGTHLTQTLRLALPAATVWAALQDPALVATCVPGAELGAIEGNRIQGAMRLSLGPIRSYFNGTAVLTFDPEAMSGTVVGEGRDSASNTALSGEARFWVKEDEPSACRLILSISYTLRGSLSQFGRGPIVEVFAAELAERTGRALEARLGGRAEVKRDKLGAALFARIVWRWLRGLASKKTR